MSVEHPGSPLARKLGLRPDLVVYLDAPRVSSSGDPVLDVERLDLGLDCRTRLPRRLDVALLFCPDQARLHRRFPLLLERLGTDGAIWACWPKRASGVRTDLDGAVVRAHGLAAGLVDVTVVAVDEVWSGLRFVRRLRDR